MFNVPHTGYLHFLTCKIFVHFISRNMYCLKFHLMNVKKIPRKQSVEMISVEKEKYILPFLIIMRERVQTEFNQHTNTLSNEEVLQMNDESRCDSVFFYILFSMFIGVWSEQQSNFHLSYVFLFLFICIERFFSLFVLFLFCYFVFSFFLSFAFCCKSYLVFMWVLEVSNHKMKMFCAFVIIFLFLTIYNPLQNILRQIYKIN